MIPGITESHAMKNWHPMQLLLIYIYMYIYIYRIIRKLESQREPCLLAHFLGDVAIYTALQPPMGHDSPSLDTASICDLDQHAKDHGA